jgi:integrase
VAHFIRTFGIQSPEELRKIDHRAVMAWERLMREQESASTVPGSAALSSLFATSSSLVCGTGQCVMLNGRVNRREGRTLAFSQKQARSILDAPASNTLLGARDRAILAVGLQVGFRRAEIAGLKVGDFHMNRGFDALKVVRKGGKKGGLAVHPQAAQRIRDYLELAGHGHGVEGPLVRPVRDNRKGLAARRPLHPDVMRSQTKPAMQSREIAKG